MRQVKITIGKAGQRRLEADGFTGGACKELINRLTQGDTTISEEDKPELYLEETEREREVQ